MADYLQAERPLKITTPLGPDALLLTGLRGTEGVSSLFHFELDLLAEVTTSVAFDQLVGKYVTMEMQRANEEVRYFHGLVKSFSRGRRDDKFISYQAEVVPRLWLLTRQRQSRIFQRLSVVEILEQVFTGLAPNFRLNGSYKKRDYCVQYQETNFDFASRLMEEEGIYYYFLHSERGHQLVISDATAYPMIPSPSSVIYEELEGGLREETRIIRWDKRQELRSSQYTARDRCFEIPRDNLNAAESSVGSVKVGQTTHKLTTADLPLELYEYPGGYAKRFDAVSPAGDDQPSELQNIYSERDRTVRIRMEEEESHSLRMSGASNCGHLFPAHKFRLSRHWEADDEYLVLNVQHAAKVSNYRSGSKDDIVFTYDNEFEVMPAAMVFRPPRVTAAPLIQGVQTATVTGTSGEEIHLDKYGRVKVQFHWDREGKLDAASSCWVRVAQLWAGNRWGGFFWPRIGHEVVISFEDGDPDQPLIVGSVYNADNMPPFKVPLYGELGGIKSRSFSGTSGQNYNGIVFVDTNGAEHLGIHSERHLSFTTEQDILYTGGRHKGEHVGSVSVTSVGDLPGGGGSGGGLGDFPCGGGSGGGWLPEGGGSGGGSDQTETAPTVYGFSKNQPSPWVAPAPNEVLGLNAAMTFGDQIGAVLGMQQAMCVGSNITLNFNPLSLFSYGVFQDAIPAPLRSASGGIGAGSATYTFGDNLTFNAGQTFQVNLGPSTNLVYREKCKVVVIVLCALALSMVTLFYILFKVLDSDVKRAQFALSFQGVLDVLLATILILMKEDGDETEATRVALCTAFGTTAEQADPASPARWKQILGSATQLVALLGTLAVPLAIAGDEVSRNTNANTGYDNDQWSTPSTTTNP